MNNLNLFHNYREAIIKKINHDADLPLKVTKLIFTKQNNDNNTSDADNIHIKIYCNDQNSNVKTTMYPDIAINSNIFVTDITNTQHARAEIKQLIQMITKKLVQKSNENQFQQNIDDVIMSYLTVTDDKQDDDQHE